MIRAAITGVSSFLPKDILTNEDLSKMVDTTDEWIMSRIGIKERRILKGENLGTSYMGIQAVNELIKKTKINPEEVDLVIFGTTTPDYPIPSTAVIVAKECKMKNAFAFDLNAACSGFIYSLEVASNFIKSGMYKKIVVLAGDKLSSITNYKDRATCPLFGDAVGAVLIEPTEEEVGIMDTIMRSDGVGVPYLNLQGGGSVYPSSQQTIEENKHYLYQEGQTVFKHAVSKMADVSVGIMEKNNLTYDDISWFVPHQANVRIIEAVGNRMKIPTEKVIMNIQNYGNTSAASIPLGLADNEFRFKKGDNIILSAFGAGFTWGAVFLKWAY